MKVVAAARRKGGRPSQQQAAALEGIILDAATALFFSRGYGLTSVESIVASAHISKRTFYDRYSDKAAVFTAVVHRIIGRLRPSDTAGLFEGKNAEELLRHIARVIVHASLTPEALALHRLILAEAARFPELALAMEREGARQEAIQRIGVLLQHEAEAGRFYIPDPAFAAEQFLQMVVSAPQRRAMGLGQPLTSVEIDRWAEATVDLFLNGCRKKT